MVTKEEVLKQFQLLNIEPPDNVLSKCVEMCLNYDIDAEEFVDQWIAFTTSNLHGEAPTVKYLERMERKEYQKSKDQTTKRSAHKPQTSVSENASFSASPYSTPSGHNAPVIGTPKGNHVPMSRIQTPVQSRRLLDEILDTTISSPGAQSGTYKKRTDARVVRCSYGSNSAQFRRESNMEITLVNTQQNVLQANTRYMYEVIGKKAAAINEMADYVGHSILNKYGLCVHDSLLRHCVGELVTYGRIVSDSDGKINSQSVLLEGTIQTNSGFAASLNLSKMTHYSLFPGQVVAVKGNYLVNTNKLVADQIYCDTNILLPTELAVTEGPLQMIIASGPFTVQDNLAFEPLNDLIQYVKEYKPHILILAGPFYERSNEGIFNGELTQSFDTLFADLIGHIMSSLNDVEVEVVVVSSQREPHHHPVYPTLPYAIREKYKNLKCMPDPCILNVNGLIVGITTADILFHISNFEIYLDKTSSAPPDRMGRIASHLLKQQSFYPLDPPHKDVNLDHTFMEKFGVMDIKPHILVLPSNLRHFIKNIDDCLVINPERLSKGCGGGTFARLEVLPGSTSSICDRTNCQVIKI